MKYLTGIVVSLVASPAVAYRTFLDGYFPGLANSFKKTVNTTLEAGKLLTQAGSNSGGSLVFEDNFDELNFKRWRHEVTLGGGGNWEFQHYNNNRSVSYTEDGVLYIKPMLTAEVMGEAAVMNGGTLDVWGNMPNFQCTANAFYGCMRSSNGENIINPIQSAQLRSHQSFNFRYGKVEVRARLPKGDWIWPAIWFLPTDHEYGMWPSSGEIDLVESRGNAPGYPAGGVDTVMSTLHWGPSFEFNRYEQTTSQYKLPNGQTFADDFHTFTLEWSSDAINTFVDGNPVLRVPITESFWDQGKFPASQANPWKHSKSKAAPFDKDFYIIFNVAVGGTNSYFPEGSGKPWSNKSPTAAKDFYLAKNQWLPTWPEDDRRALAIDYVRVWQYE